MAIKGNAYTKTTWAFEERPVASSKLNLWDDRIETGLEMLHFFLGHAWSGVDGVLRGVTADGRVGAPLRAAEVSVGRSTGFPRIARAGSDLVVVWTEDDKTTRIRAVTIPIKSVIGDQ